MRKRQPATRNVRRTDNVQRCECKTPLTSVQVANGYKFCSEECFWVFSGSGSTLMDDPESFNDD